MQAQTPVMRWPADFDGAHHVTRATQTRYYKALDGRDFVQFSTPGRRGWLVTNGPASEARDLQSQHVDLIRLAG